MQREKNVLQEKYGERITAGFEHAETVLKGWGEI